MPHAKRKRDSEEFAPNSLQQFKTTVDADGRQCTYCLEYKPWSAFYVASKTYTGKQSCCKVCKTTNHPKRLYKEKENKAYIARRKFLKSNDPIELKARDIRSRLLTRERQHPHIAGTTPSKAEIKQWLEDQMPLVCYYSGEPLKITDKYHVDHKMPVQRGGTNLLSNLCICSSRMNTAKGGLTDHEFKELLDLISSWDGGGERLLRRMRQGFYG